MRRLLNVQPGGVVNVFKLSFSNGKADDGGAILNRGALTLTNCTVSISEAARGGGISNEGGQVTINASTVAANTSLGQMRSGGGVSNSSGPLSLRSSIVADNNFTIMDVPAGDGYEIKAKASLQLDEMFSYSFPPVCVDVSAAGVLTAKTCETQTALSRLDIVGVKREKRFADIEGRVTDGAGKGGGGVTITLSGPKTAVFIVPECSGQDSDCGRYEFKDVPTGVDYTMTPKKDVVGFLAHPFDNQRGGADMNNLGADGAVGADGKVKVGVDFDAGFGPPPPTPSDKFTADETDPNRFKNGVVSLAPESFEPAVRVVQGDGQLQITPRAFNATQQQQGAAQSADVPVERFNGYVSVRDIDLNTSTSVSVKAAQPLAEGGAQTVFSVGNDSKNFYRIRVGDPASGLGPVGVSSQVRAGGTTTTAAAADAPAIFFEALAGGRQVPERRALRQERGRVLASALRAEDADAADRLHGHERADLRALRDER